MENENFDHIVYKVSQISSLHFYYGKTHIDRYKEGYPIKNPGGTELEKRIKRYGESDFLVEIVGKFKYPYDASNFESYIIDKHISHPLNINQKRERWYAINPISKKALLRNAEVTTIQKRLDRILTPSVAILSCFMFLVYISS